MLIAVLFSAALANEPVVTLESNHTVVGEVTVQASAEACEALLKDPKELATLSSDVLSTEVEAPRADGCREVKRKAKGLFRPLMFRTVRCEKDEKIVEELIPGDDFTDYSVEWDIVENDGEVTIKYKARSGVNLPVPQTVVDRSAVRAAKELLSNLVRKLTGKGNRR